jgi:hypothetical protein
MKKILFITFFALFAFASFAQKLTEIYKKGVVKLVPDKEYALNNNWNKIFNNYYDTLYGKPMGNRKSLKLLPDGSVVVNHAYRNFYTKFSPIGKFEKEFYVKNSNGEPFKKIKSIEGVINNNTLFTGIDNTGKMICFDLNGNYKKTLKLDYMASQMIPLPNNKIAAAGFAIWKSKFHDFVAIIDYETNQQKIIWEYFTDNPELAGTRKLFNYSYRFKSGGMVGCNTMPFTKESGLTTPPVIASVDNKLIVAIPITGEIRIYDLEGNLVSQNKTEWTRNYITVKEQKEIQQKAINEYKSAENLFGKNAEESKSARNYIIKEMEIDLGKITDPILLPAFSTIIKDSDGNLLFFEFAKEENANKFNVWIYENDGKFVCQSSFICDEYNLEINPSKMVFYNGYIYGLQLLK